MVTPFFYNIDERSCEESLSYLLADDWISGPGFGSVSQAVIDFEVLNGENDSIYSSGNQRNGLIGLINHPFLILISGALRA